jgi:hypothetical protein
LAGRTFRQRLSSLPGYAPLSAREPGRWDRFFVD